MLLLKLHNIIVCGKLMIPEYAFLMAMQILQRTLDSRPQTALGYIRDSHVFTVLRS